MILNSVQDIINEFEGNELVIMPNQREAINTYVPLTFFDFPILIIFLLFLVVNEKVFLTFDIATYRKKRDRLGKICRIYSCNCN